MLFRAAILIPLFLYQDEVFVILTQRSHRLKTHAGEVCFPGGKYDRTDGCLLNTAFREAFEEIGLQSENISILGRLFPVRSIHGLLVFPFVGLIKNMEMVKLKLNLDEVEDVFACPLHFFLNSSSFHKFENNRHWNFLWTSNPNSYIKKSNNMFLRHVFDGHKTFSIFGLTGLYCIVAASICLNQQPTLESFILDEVFKDLRKFLMHRSRETQPDSKL